MRLSKVPSIVPLIRNLSLLFMAIAAVAFSVHAGRFSAETTPYVPALSSDYYYEQGKNLIGFLPENAGNVALKKILTMEIPTMGIVDTEKTGFDVSKAALLALNVLSGVNLEDPLTFFKAEIPMMDVTPVTADSLDEADFGNITEPTEPPATPPLAGGQDSTEPVKNNITSDKPLIALYNTHSSETFELTDGVTHKKAGEAGGVATVASEIQKLINEKYHIGVKFDPTIHDKSFNKSYAVSEKTARKLIQENPDLKLIFDIHRDGAMTREQSVTTINGQKVGKLLIVVGTDARAENPKWRENLQLARKLVTKLNEMYPGLCRGITIKEGRYNQHLSTHSLLVEIGSAKNTTDEAVAAGKLFAEAVVALLNDMEAGK